MPESQLSPRVLGPPPLQGEEVAELEGVRGRQSRRRARGCAGRPRGHLVVSRSVGGDVDGVEEAL